MLEPLFFHHMVGTAGNTFCRAIANSNPARKHLEVRYGIQNQIINTELIFNAIKEPCLIRGHNIYGLIELCGLSYKYSTLLRNPYDRLITDWFWKYNSEINNGHLKNSRYNSYADFLKFVDKFEHLEFYIHHLGVLDYHNNQHFSIDECSKTPNSEAYLSSRTALTKKFNFVGIAENMDLSLYSYSKIVHLTNLANWVSSRHMKTPNRPQFDELPTKYQNTIISKTKFDKLLYDEARNDFYDEFSFYEKQDEYHKYFDNNSEDLTIQSFEINNLDNPEKIITEKLLCLKDGLKVAFYGIGGLCQTLVNGGYFDRFVFVAQFDSNTNTQTKFSNNTHLIQSIKDFNIDVLVITSSRLKIPYNEEALRLKRENSLKFIII